jgi:cytochrome c oxidase subunit III
MIAETYTPQELLERSIRTRQMITWFLIFAIVMFFAGLTSAYVVSMGSGYWVHMDLPQAFYISTAAILVSSLFAQAALWAAGKGRTALVTPLLVVTLVLGGVFTWSQFKGWSQLVERGQYVVGGVMNVRGTYGEDYTISRQGEVLVEENGNFYLPGDQARQKPVNADLEEHRNTAGSYLYALTAAHLFHVGFGLLSLLVMIAMSAVGRYSSSSHAGLWSGVVYWHFLGGLWVYLLLFLTFVH